jgi:glycosyltransferase involved in cell wall biosynthesis
MFTETPWLKNAIRKSYAVLTRFQLRGYQRTGWPVVHLEGGERSALLMYLSPPLRWKKADPRFHWHENQRQSAELARVLQSEGFSVDVADFRDSSFIPEKHYDLFIGHPGLNARRIMPLLSADRKICLEPGQYGPEADRKIEMRFQIMCKHRGVTIKPELHNGNELQDYLQYDAVACFGNAVTAESYASIPVPVFTFPNYPNRQIQYFHRDFSAAKSRFLYIAAGHHVRKGLDLLLEVFATRPEVDLFICGKVPEWMRHVFKAELEKKNIHRLGTVDLSSRQFSKLAEQCAFYISPTCAEGMQGGALNAMASGMIPVLHRQAGIDLPPGGIEIEENTVEHVAKAVEAALSIPEKKLPALSVNCEEMIQRSYTPAAFASRWREIIKTVCAEQCR